MENKFGIEICSYKRWGENRYKKLAEHGFSCVDYNMMDTNSLPYSDSFESTEKQLLEEKKLADESNVEIYQVHGPWPWPYDDNEEDHSIIRLEKVKRSLWATSVLGCKNWVIHPLMPCGINDRGTENQKITLDVNIDFIHKILDEAKSYGITICLENMPFINFSLATPYEILDFVKLINDDNFKICLDTGHVATFPELSAAQAVRDLGNEIRAFHIHDSVPDRDLHMLPCFGTTDWIDFSKAVKEINYKGVLSLETAPPQKLPDDIFEDLCINLLKIMKMIFN